MRKWVPLVLALALVPVATPLAAQEKQDPGRPISRTRAVDIAVATVAAAVQRGELRGSWLPAGPVQAERLSGNVVKTLAAWNGQPVYLVAVTAPRGSGHVRVVVHARNGKTLDVRMTSSDWGSSPAWWQQGLNSPPPAKR